MPYEKPAHLQDATVEPCGHCGGIVYRSLPHPAGFCSDECADAFATWANDEDASDARDVGMYDTTRERDRDRDSL